MHFFTAHLSLAKLFKHKRYCGEEVVGFPCSAPVTLDAGSSDDAGPVGGALRREPVFRYTLIPRLPKLTTVVTTSNPEMVL